eukprot:6188953-Pleurochrysis_carterae.AAC.7
MVGARLQCCATAMTADYSALWPVMQKFTIKPQHLFLSRSLDPSLCFSRSCHRLSHSLPGFELTLKVSGDKVPSTLPLSPNFSKKHALEVAMNSSWTDRPLSHALLSSSNSMAHQR